MDREAVENIMRERGGKKARNKPDKPRKVPGGYAEKGYFSRLEKRYGMTPDEYWALYDKQDGKCAIYGCDPTVRYANCHKNQQRLHVDH